MVGTRERALRAAVDEVGDFGIRALTHARVDARAGLPNGSTSNWFRTREALVSGLIVYIAESERADAGPASDVPITRAGQLVDAICNLIDVQTTTHARRTRVRLALFLEAAHDTALLAPMIAQRAEFVAWTTALLAAIGASRPEDAARTLLASGNGLVFHRLTVDPDADVRSVVERTVRACLD